MSFWLPLLDVQSKLFLLKIFFIENERRIKMVIETSSVSPKRTISFSSGLYRSKKTWDEIPCLVCSTRIASYVVTFSSFFCFRC